MMRKKTHMYHISTSSGLYESWQDAINDANALKRKITNECKRNNYACLVLIGISENESDKSCFVSSGYRGRKAVITEGGFPATQVPPHLHILILANPGATISTMIEKYLNKRHRTHFKGNTCWLEHCEDYLTNVFHYVMKQSKKYRVVSHNLQSIPIEALSSFAGTGAAVSKLLHYDIDCFQTIYDKCIARTVSPIQELDDEPFTLSDPETLNNRNGFMVPQNYNEIIVNIDTIYSTLQVPYREAQLWDI